MARDSKHRDSAARAFPRVGSTVLGAALCAAVLGAGAVVSCSAAGPEESVPAGLKKIKHVVVIYQENHSFDNLYGTLPGVDGLGNAGNAVHQVDKTGTAYALLPQPIDTSLTPPAPDSRFPSNMPVAPFDIESYVPADQATGDLVHRFYQNQYQIDGGKNDKYVAWSDAAGLVMGYYDAKFMPEGQLARDYTICDNFFQAAFGGSFLNHIWLIAAASPPWPNAPSSKVIQLDANGILVRDGSVTPDGYAVNTSYSVNQPHPASITDPTQLVPSLTLPTIGDRLSAKKVSWAWYAGGYTNALAGHPDPLYQYHHNPFIYFEKYKDGSRAKADHIKDEPDFLSDLQNGKLPAVSFVKPLGAMNEHPGYANLMAGQQHVADLVADIQNSKYWWNTVVIITYDENGGFWDHVTPPSGDRWGPGTRVPTIIVSPYSKKGYVDHTRYDTTSILKLIESRFNLQALSARDAAATNLLNAFDFTQKP
jgi:phospholipase C